MVKVQHKLLSQIHMHVVQLAKHKSRYDSSDCQGLFNSTQIDQISRTNLKNIPPIVLSVADSSGKIQNKSLYIKLLKSNYQNYCVIQKSHFLGRHNK